MSGDEVCLYVCPRCITPSDMPGPCPNCRIERVACQPGRDGEPLRKPLVGEDGQLLSQAPIWWLRRTVGDLVDRHLRAR